MAEADAEVVDTAVAEVEDMAEPVEEIEEEITGSEEEE